MSPDSTTLSPNGWGRVGNLLHRGRFWQYSQLVRSTYRANLVRYWPIWETVGTAVSDLSNNRGNAVSSGLTLKQAGIGDGHQCPSFSSSYVNVYSAAYNTIFPRAAGTLAVWAKVASAGVWTDGTARRVFQFMIDASNYFQIAKTLTNNQLQCVYRSNGGGTKIISTTAYALTTWLHFALAWDSVADTVSLYINGNLIQTLSTLGGALTGALNATQNLIGAAVTTPSNPWSGYLAHAALWNVALPAQAVKRLSRF